MDLLPEIGEQWQLFGYRLEDKPYYTALASDEQGGLSFATVGLRFVVVEQRIEVYDVATGQRLLNNEEANLRQAGIEP